jgi:hypothetical protein
MKNNHVKGKKLIKNIKAINVTKKNSFSNSLLCIFLLLIGILVGISLNITGTFALEDASSSNATSSDATSSNATSSDATSSNATSSNVSSTDNILYLNSISLSSTSVNAGDKIYVNKNTSGACNSAMTIYFKEKSTNTTFSVNVESLNNNPYFIVPVNIASGTYDVTDIVFIGLNSDNTTFTKHYSKSGSVEDVSAYDFNISISVKGNEEDNTITLNKISILNSSASVGDKVSLNISTSENLTSLKLDFKSSNGNIFSTYVNSLTSNPYFTIASTVKADSYSLYRATLISSKTTTIYTNNNYDFNVSLTIKDNSGSYIYNNEDITDDIIKEIYNNKEDLEITINADGKSIISEELFNAIKGTKKKLIINYGENQLVFCGNDIDNPKSIDVSMSTELVKKNEDLKELISDGIIVNFASNGNLPGNATVKIKITDDMKEKFGSKKIYVYYYDETEKGFNTIASEISASNGYYQFNISHNSKYLLTATAVDDSLILDVEDNLVSNPKTSGSYITIMLVVAVVIIAGILIYKNRKEIFKK